MVKAIESQVEEEQAPPTENEMAIAKAEMKIEKMKHIDARNALLDYVFPLLRRMASESGDLAEAMEDAVDDLNEKIEALNSDDSDVVGVLEDARNMIVTMAGLLDQAMVAAGFCTVTKKDDQVVLNVNDKMPKELRTVYEQIGPSATKVVTDIQEAIEAAGEEDEEEIEEDEGDEDTNPSLRPNRVSGEARASVTDIADGANRHVTAAVVETNLVDVLPGTAGILSASTSVPAAIVAASNGVSGADRKADDAQEGA